MIPVVMLSPFIVVLPLASKALNVTTWLKAKALTGVANEGVPVPLPDDYSITSKVDVQ